MQPNDFSPSAPGRLVKTYDGALAFVPAPIPEDLSPSWDLANLNALAVGALKELAGLAQTLPNEYLPLRPFLQREAVLSSRIEGTHTSLGQLFLYEVEAKELTADAQEVANYSLALDYGLERLKTLPVSLPLLKEMHAILMKGVRGGASSAGSFRRVQNWIGGTTPQSARYVPPPVPEMTQCLHDLELYLHAPSRVPFLVRLACVHYQFEAIHPFEDGNGRVGRLLLSLLLCSEEILPRPLVYLSGYFERNRTAYYDGLLNVSCRGDWGAWISYFLVGVEAQSMGAVRRTRALLQLRVAQRDLLQALRAPAPALHLLDELFGLPYTTIARAAGLLGVSPRTARKAVDLLENCGILTEVTGRQRSRLFVSDEVFKILDHPEPFPENWVRHGVAEPG